MSEPAKINLAAEFAQSGVGPVLKQLDDELIGLDRVPEWLGPAG